MASESSILCKRWREKRKDDVEYWNQERSRKREARRTRSDEKKQHDRELSRKRQKKYRDRKKQKRCKESSSVIEVDGATDETGIVTEDVSSGSHDADMSSMLISVPESDYMLPESDALTSSSFWETETDGIKDGDSPPDLHNFKSNRSDKETAPHMNLIQDTDGKGEDIINNDNARQAYFETIQTTLSQIEDFNSVKSRCSSISQYIEQTFPIRDLPTLDVRGYHLDNVASTLYPHDDSPNNLVPICTVGDGNCLPRVGSLFAFGDEKHHVEMRVRIFMELCQFEDNYLDDSYLNRGTEKSIKNIAMIFAQYSVDDDLTDKHMCREVFRKYMNTVLQPNTFNGIWSIFALASVLGVQIFSIYPPNRGYNVRPHLHRQVMPRICRHENNRIVHIMWTSTKGKQQEPLSWTPNHFVAVLPTQGPIHSSVQEDRVGPIVLNIQVGTDQSGSDVRSGATPSNPMDVPSKYRPNEKVETPTFITLQNVSREYSTVPLIHEAPERTIPLQQTGHDNPTMPTLTVSEGSVDGNDTKRRHEDRCLSHPNEELLYLCTTCSGLPICYKCHLQEHQCHKLTDLKACLAETETLYVKKLTKKEENLKDEIEKRKLDHVQNMQCIEREIDDAHTFYNEQLSTWECNQKARMRDRDQKINRQLQDQAAQLGNPDTSVEEKLLELRKLPVSQRLSVMSTEPRQETLSGGYPRTKLVFRDIPVQLLSMLGSLAEIPCQSDIPTTDGSMQADNGSEPLILPDGDKGRTHTEREGPGKSTNGDADMAIKRGTANTDLSTMNNYDTRFRGLETNIPASSMFTQNDQAWIPGSIETLPNNNQRAPYGTSHNVQSSAYGRLAVPSYNVPVSNNGRLWSVQNSTGTQISEVNTVLNQDHVTFARNTSNENRCTRLGTSPVIKGDINVETVGPTNLYRMGSHHHIHRSTTDTATEPFVTTNFSQTTLNQRHCDPGFTGLMRMESQNSRYSEDHKYVSEGLALDKTVHTVNLIPADRLTHTPIGILSDVGSVVNEFTLPSSIFGPAYFKSVGTMLYVYDYIKHMLLQVSKTGVIQQETQLNLEHLIRVMCVSPVDNTIWFVSTDGIIRRITSSGTIEEIFKVNGSPVGILVRSSGDVVVVTSSFSDDNLTLTLYTATGQVMQSSMVTGIAFSIWDRIKECPQTHEITVLVIYFFSSEVILYDSSLTSSRRLEVTVKGTSPIIRDICFDRRGHVLLCCADRIKMFEQSTGDHIRTVYLNISPHFYPQLCDVDDANVLWVFRNSDRITGIRL